MKAACINYSVDQNCPSRPFLWDIDPLNPMESMRKLVLRGWSDPKEEAKATIKSIGEIEFSYVDEEGVQKSTVYIKHRAGFTDCGDVMIELGYGSFIFVVFDLDPHQPYHQALIDKVVWMR